MKLKRWKVLCGKYLGSSSGERLHSVMKGEWVVIPHRKRKQPTQTSRSSADVSELQEESVSVLQKLRTSKQK